MSNKQAEPLWHRKGNFHVAYGNVQTLLDAGVRTLTMRELRKHNVDIACLSEVRIPNSGHSVTKVPGEEACYHLYRSKVVDNIRWHGVAIALSEAAQAAQAAWVPNSPRLASALLKGMTVHLTVVAIYTLTLDATEEAKDSFYDNLQNAEVSQETY